MLVTESSFNPTIPHITSLEDSFYSDNKHKGGENEKIFIDKPLEQMLNLAKNLYFTIKSKEVC